MTPAASSVLVLAVASKASNCLASRRPQFLRRFMLQAMQIGDSPLGMGCRGEDCPSIIAEQLQPGLKVGRMIRTRFQFRYDAEIGGSCPATWCRRLGIAKPASAPSTAL